MNEWRVTILFVLAIGSLVTSYRAYGYEGLFWMIVVITILVIAQGIVSYLDGPYKYKG